MLTFQCHSCGQKIKVEGMLAGQGMRCPRCRQTVRVPHEPVNLSAHGPTIEEGRAADHIAAPTLAQLAEREKLRVAATAADSGDELQLQPVMPPPLRKPGVAASASPAPAIVPPADDADDFKLQPLAPPPLRKPPSR